MFLTTTSKKRTEQNRIERVVTIDDRLLVSACLLPYKIIV